MCKPGLYGLMVATRLLLFYTFKIVFQYFYLENLSWEYRFIPP